jgi:hypothetical protein
MNSVSVDRADVVLERLEARPAELQVEELDVEVGVVDDELGAGDEVEEILRHLGEFRLLPQVVERKAVHPGGAEVNVALRVR